MRYLGLLIMLYVINDAGTDSASKDYVDPNDAEDNAFLWKNLFIKLNTMIKESDKLNENIMEVNKRLDELTHRLDSQDALLRKSFNYSLQWTTILRRQDGSVNFNRNWNEYSNGFGHTDGEFFMGLQKLHDITTYGPAQELMIILKDFDGQTNYAKYDLFRIGSEAEKYALVELGAYSGDAGNDFASHRGHKFTTSDQDNDDNDSRNNGEVFQGGWWFYSLGYHCYLNGPYRQENASNTWGISSHPFREWNHSLKYAEMMIRPKL